MKINKNIGSIAAYAATTIETIEKSQIPAILQNTLYTDLVRIYDEQREAIKRRVQILNIPTKKHVVNELKEDYDALFFGIDYAVYSKDSLVKSNASILLDAVKSKRITWTKVKTQDLFVYCNTIVDIFSEPAQTAALKGCGLTDQFAAFKSGCDLFRERWVEVGNLRKKLTEKSPASVINRSLLLAVRELTEYVRLACAVNKDPLWIALNSNLEARRSEFQAMCKVKPVADNVVVPENLNPDKVA